MNKKQIVASLHNIANSLDNSGLYKEASSLTNVMKRVAQNDPIFDSRQKQFPLDTMTAMGPARVDLSGYQLTEEELPRWIKEKRDRSQNSPKPRVLHPSEIQSNQKVDEIFPDFMENYEKLFDDNPDFDFGTTDPRVLHEISIEFLHDEANDPNKYLQNKINKMEEKYQNWFEQNFNFTIDHMRFIRYFMDSNNLNSEQMESLLRKVYK
jgi:hypothetical protein